MAAKRVLVRFCVPTKRPISEAMPPLPFNEKWVDPSTIYPLELHAGCVPTANMLDIAQPEQDTNPNEVTGSMLVKNIKFDQIQNLKGLPVEPENRLMYSFGFSPYTPFASVGNTLKKPTTIVLEPDAATLKQGKGLGLARAKALAKFASSQVKPSQEEQEEKDQEMAQLLEDYGKSLNKKSYRKCQATSTLTQLHSLPLEAEDGVVMALGTLAQISEEDGERLGCPFGHTSEEDRIIPAGGGISEESILNNIPEDFTRESCYATEVFCTAAGTTFI
jgi:hypothetical protein